MNKWLLIPFVLDAGIRVQSKAGELRYEMKVNNIGDRCAHYTFSRDEKILFRKEDVCLCTEIGYLIIYYRNYCIIIIYINIS